MPDKPCGHDECDHGPDEAFAAMVDELVTVYGVRTRLLPGVTLTVHAEITDEVFTLQIGTGRDAAAYMAAAQLARDVMRGL